METKATQHEIEVCKCYDCTCERIAQIEIFAQEEFRAMAQRAPRCNASLGGCGADVQTVVGRTLTGRKYGGGN